MPCMGRIVVDRDRGQRVGSTQGWNFIPRESDGMLICATWRKASSVRRGQLFDLTVLIEPVEAAAEDGEADERADEADRVGLAGSAFAGADFAEGDGEHDDAEDAQRQAAGGSQRRPNEDGPRGPRAAGGEAAVGETAEPLEARAVEAELIDAFVGAEACVFDAPGETREDDGLRYRERGP